MESHKTQAILSSLKDILTRIEKTRLAGLLYTCGIACLVIAGLVLRFRQYLAARSLWFDEAMLAVNIVNRGFGEFTSRLFYDQVAPLGFLFSEKIVFSFLGAGDLKLRLLPFIAGLVSLPLFAMLAKNHLSKWGTAGAVLIFSISWPMTYYSNELKQYSLDVLFVIIVLLIYDLYLQKRDDSKRLIALALAGMIGLWFSQPLIFILASVGLYELMRLLRARQIRQVRRVMLVGLFWIINFLFLYYLSYHIHAGNLEIKEQWAPYFMPMPPWTDLAWFKGAFQYILLNAAGLPPALWISAVLSGLGILHLSLRRDSALVAIPLFSVAITLIASGLTFYPIYTRFMVFLAPMVILVFVAGFEWILGLLSRFAPKGLSLVLVSIFLLVVTQPIFRTALNYYQKPYTREHIKPVLGYLQSHIQPGDIVYVYYGAEPALSYYLPLYKINSDHFIYGIRDRENIENYYTDLTQLINNHRVWVIFSHIYNWDETEEKSIFLDFLDAHGDRLLNHESEGSSIYLFYLYK
jgi:hypothetical protein